MGPSAQPNPSCVDSALPKLGRRQFPSPKEWGNEQSPHPFPLTLGSKPSTGEGRRIQNNGEMKEASSFFLCDEWPRGSSCLLIPPSLQVHALHEALLKQPLPEGQDTSGCGAWLLHPSVPMDSALEHPAFPGKGHGASCIHRLWREPRCRQSPQQSGPGEPTLPSQPHLCPGAGRCLWLGPSSASGTAHHSHLT